jgi:hypothetical protein
MQLIESGERGKHRAKMTTTDRNPSRSMLEQEEP